MAINGKLISSLIEDKTKLSRYELSMKTGISYNTLKRRLESGQGWELDELQLISEVIGTTVTELLSQAEASQDHKQAA